MDMFGYILIEKHGCRTYIKLYERLPIKNKFKYLSKTLSSKISVSTALVSHLVHDQSISTGSNEYPDSVVKSSDHLKFSEYPTL